MVFKPFQFQVIVRLVFIAVTCYGISYVLQLNGYWFTLWNLIVFLILQVIFFFRFLTKWQRDLKVFANSVKHGDYSITYHLLERSDPNYDLYDMLNSVTCYVREVKAQHEQQNQYLQHVIENVQVGLIAYDNEGKIHLNNNEALKLLGQSELTNIHSLRERELYSQLTALALNQPKLIVIKRESLIKLSARLSKIIVGGKSFFLLSLVNIRPELEENELQSWQELISVLTHEIMNSVSPIHSLSGSMVKYLDRIEGNEETVLKARNSLEVITRRSQSLMGFVDRYRTISTVPLPNKHAFKAGMLISSVLTLLDEDLKGVEVKVIHEDEIVTADFQQIEQVLINLLKNAVYSMDYCDKKQIRISVHSSKDSPESRKTYLQVADSGKGIPANIIDKIFIPFFTTRQGGSGIGLTLSRQIMQRHGGTIEVKSEEGIGTVFTLIFPHN